MDLATVSVCMVYNVGHHELSNATTYKEAANPGIHVYMTRIYVGGLY